MGHFLTSWRGSVIFLQIMAFHEKKQPKHAIFPCWTCIFYSKCDMGCFWVDTALSTSKFAPFLFHHWNWPLLTDAHTECNCKAFLHSQHSTRLSMAQTSLLHHQVSEALGGSSWHVYCQGGWRPKSGKPYWECESIIWLVNLAFVGISVSRIGCNFRLGYCWSLDY